MSVRLAVADTCFIIDWVRFRRRDIIFKLFQSILVPEQILAEVEDEKTISWLSRELARGNITLFTPSPQDLREAEKLVFDVLSRPHMRRIEMPEAICIILGKRLNAVVLTENRGAYLAVRVLDFLRNVTVWRALEVLREALKRRVIPVNSEEEVLEVFKEYEEDTHHLFPRNDLRKVVEEVVRWLKA